MKTTNYLKHIAYMRQVIQTKYPDYGIIWAGENNFILVKDGTETRIKYE